MTAAAAAARFAERREDGFTGGDAAYSVPLPDGRTTWMFGDSFVGGVQPDGSRSHDPRTFVRNSLVVTESDPTRPSRMVVAGDGADHQDFARPAGAAPNKNGLGPDPWYWPGDGVARGHRLQLLMSRMTPGVEDPWWGWKHVGTDLVTVDTRDMSLVDIRPTDSGSRVTWGAAILDTGDWTYVYGAEPHGDTKLAHVARAPAGDLSKPWSFWDGNGWSADHERSKALPVEVSNQFSVIQAEDGVRLVTQRGFDHALHVSRAAAPEGPWLDAGIAARIPALPAGSYPYNAVVHEHLSGADDLLVSYNVSSPHFMDDHRVYRPHFLDLPRSRVDHPDHADATAAGSVVAAGPGPAAHP